MALTPRQRRFVTEYLVDHNGAQAAIRAGYAESGARQEATRLLAKADIRAAVDEAEKKHAEAVGISVEWVLDGLKKVADSDDVTPMKVKAFELIGKHLRMFTEKVEHSGPEGGPIAIVGEGRMK